MIFHSSYGIDLGTDTIKICDKNEKNFLCEKNMIAIRDKVNVIALGQKAFEMYEKTPMNVEAGSPMTGGAIADVKNAELVLTGLLKRCGGVLPCGGGRVLPCGGGRGGALLLETHTSYESCASH